MVINFDPSQMLRIVKSGFGDNEIRCYGREINNYLSVRDRGWALGRPTRFKDALNVLK